MPWTAAGGSSWGQKDFLYYFVSKEYIDFSGKIPPQNLLTKNEKKDKK
jgi:hypothetical protein